jgi:hopanoid-associated phosphorylase
VSIPDPSDATGAPLGAPILLVSGLSFEARIAAGPGIDTLCWARPDRLAELLDERVSGAYRGLVSFGTCGGLDEDLAAGQWIIADEVLAGERRYRCDPAWTEALRAALPEAANGTMAAAQYVLTSTAEKRQLFEQSGARAVDMESHVVAAAADRLGIPFTVARVVVDPATRSLPSVIQSAVRENGDTAPGPLLLALMRRPMEFFALPALASDARQARRSLEAGRNRLDFALRWPVRRHPS